jgi:hypothetical protein
MKLKDGVRTSRVLRRVNATGKKVDVGNRSWDGRRPKWRSREREEGVNYIDRKRR